MKGNLKCLNFISVFIGLFIALSVFPVYAAEYGATYPDYVKQSSACFVECDTSLGKGALVFPVNYKKDCIGFYGKSGTDLMNCTSNTISGQFVLTNGTTYSVRAQGFGKFQYHTQDGYYNNYTDLNISQIYNTNVQFMDEQSDRGNVIFDFSLYEKFITTSIVCLILIIVAFLFYCSTLIK